MLSNKFRPKLIHIALKRPKRVALCLSSFPFPPVFLMLLAEQIYLLVGALFGALSLAPSEFFPGSQGTYLLRTDLGDITRCWRRESRESESEEREVASKRPVD